MTNQTKAPKTAQQSRPKPRKEASTATPARRMIIRMFPAWILLCLLAAMVAPNLRNVVTHLITTGSYNTDSVQPPSYEATAIAPLFTSEVDHWEADIVRWGRTYSIDPNLIATIIQIESCGHPTVSSPAGAQGLMQVMPFHFLDGEDPLDPETNAIRGVDVLADCLYSSYNPENDVGLALACYNGGPSVFVNMMSSWHPEAQSYYRWSTGIYEDATANLAESETLNQWLLAGGQGLCAGANAELSLTRAQ